jgi:hypothetical protein
LPLVLTVLSAISLLAAVIIYVLHAPSAVHDF